MAIDRRNINVRSKLATDAAMFLASRLRRAGIDVRVLSREHAERVRESSSDGEEFSVADMQKESYVWNGEAVSLAAFARAFMSHIKQKDRTVEDANRIAEAYIKNVAEDPSKHIPALLPENMSHARYFILRDGSVFGPDNAAWNSPEYQTTRGLYEIYLRVLGEDRMRDYLRLVNPSYLRNDEENALFLSMEREVNGSSLMQSSLELNAEKISAERLRAVRNIIQYFDGNNDYMPLEKALLLKGAMTWGVVDKKDGEKTDIRLVRITDSNDLSVPVIGGDLASVVEGLRHGMDFKDSLKEAIKNRQSNGRRSVPGSYTGWKCYPKSDSEDDAAVLNKDVAGTGWCTGGALSTARSHLSGGDFHVFFENGEPLIAIRTENGRMAEPPRGAHEGQFCTDREEQIAFDYITNPVNGIVAGEEYVNDILDIRRIMSPDATWKDAFNFPLQRRYRNGEFGGDTSSWGDKINQRIDELLDGISSSERRKLGYYLSYEVSVPDLDLSEVKYVRGDIIVFNDCCFPSLQSVGGRLVVGINATLQADALRSVGGYLDLGENATLQADALRSVGGYLDIRKNVSLQADALRSVGGDLYVRENATVYADALRSVRGDLYVGEDANFQSEALQSVGGNLDVRENASLQANALQSVGGDLYVYEHATLRADALQNVGKDLKVHDNASLHADALQSVGRDLYVRENASIQANALRGVGGHLRVYGNASIQAKALQSVGGYLDIRENASIQADALRSLGGDLYIGEKATVHADALRSVRGDLYVGENANLQSEALQNVGGYLSVHSEATLHVDALQSVGGYLSVQRESTLQVGALQNVGENLVIGMNATLQANALQSVGGYLSVHPEATLQANALQSVGEGLDISKNVSIQANALQSVGGDLCVYDNSTLQANALQSVGRHLIVYPEATLQANNLQSIGGGLVIRNKGTLQADALQSVGGYFDISINAKDVHIGIDYSLSDGTVYGYAIGDVIYLTPDGINPETPIHEYTHLWARVLEKNSPEQWAELVDSLRNSVEWSVVYNDSYYSNIRNDDSRLASEVFARLCGRKGAELLQQAAGESDGTVAGTVSEFRRLVDSNVMPAVFGTKGERLTDKATLAVLQDFAEGRRNSLAEVSMMPGSYHDIHRKNSSGEKITGIWRHH